MIKFDRWIDLLEMSLFEYVIWLKQMKVSSFGMDDSFQTFGLNKLSVGLLLTKNMNKMKKYE